MSDQPTDQPLAVESAYFRDHLEDFLRKAAGKFALIHGKQCLGFYDDEQEAYAAGVEAVGIEGFLIKRVSRDEDVYENPAFFLGLIDAPV